MSHFWGKCHPPLWKNCTNWMKISLCHCLLPQSHHVSKITVIPTSIEQHYSFFLWFFFLRNWILYRNKQWTRLLRYIYGYCNSIWWQSTVICWIKSHASHNVWRGWRKLQIKKRLCDVSDQLKRREIIIRKRTRNSDDLFFGWHFFSPIAIAKRR